MSAAQKTAILAQVGHFYFGAVGQFYVGANTSAETTKNNGKGVPWDEYSRRWY